MRCIKTVILVSLVGLIIAPYITAQPKPRSQDDIVIGDARRPKVLLVGTLHFAYYGHDAHKTAKDQQIDFRSEKRQAEVTELVDYVAKFRPSKIVVESKANTTGILDRYRDYLVDSTHLEINEIDQIGFRLMKRFDLDTVYGCNAWGLVSELDQRKDSLVFEAWLDDVFADYDYANDDPMVARYRQWYEYLDKIALEISLLDLFKILNARENIIGEHGAYLVGDFKLGEYRGADAMALDWYSRNLRIFRNVQRIVESPDDRILILFGSGHLGILRQQFESSPEFELVSFEALENER